jgi:hypothetical protein
MATFRGWQLPHCERLTHGAGPARACPAQLNDCPNLPVINFGASVKHSRGFFR